MNLPARQRAQAIAGRRGGGHTLAVPLAPRLAAKIAERPWDAFLTDPTQLANGLGDLIDAVRPDGVPVTLPTVLAEDDAGIRRETALEATRRLRTTVRDESVLIAVLDGTTSTVLDDVTAFLDAGVDGVVLEGDTPADVARTIGNVTRFHRAMAHAMGAGASGLPGAELVPLDVPAPKTGLVLTDGEVPADSSIPTVQDWVAAVRG
ncbi:hypothetical protein [Pseudonocardia endophytica]|uniref:Uncharacterized protein n=1 Tax=Pseudonocardia endophytica TaxID=401976 RepID=A0A4R1I1E1_PSEEN|nr:hypothetical protein [Pseudonocardia endophytica]TCK26249.1 hypothetical protein EV378_2078 [Pseudonocardia endophytica]